MRKYISEGKYILAFLLVYAAAVFILYFRFHQPAEDLITIALIFGIIFPLISWILVHKRMPVLKDKPPVKNEVLVLTVLVLWITWYIAYGTGWINSLLPKSIFSDPRITNLYVLVKKLCVFVFLPFTVYKLLGFSIADFGFAIPRKIIFSRISWILFVVLSGFILAFQLMMGQGAEPLRKGVFSVWQLLVAIPFCFVWNLFEAGLVEEFFFRSLLQSRLSVKLKSNTAGILISGLIFGLAHAPGLFLRGAQSEGISEQLPFLFWAAYTICMMSMAGVFLGILWSKTKNIYLVMALHAMVDLFPNLPDFIHDWHI